MSQTAQANNEHDRGVRTFENARTKLLELEKKHTAGELSTEAFDAEMVHIDAAIADWQRHQEIASRLTVLSASPPADHRPNYLRAGPGAPGGALPAIPDQMAADENGLLETLSSSDRRAVSRMAGISPTDLRFLSGQRRQFLSRKLMQDGGKLASDYHLSPQEEALLCLRNGPPRRAVRGEDGILQLSTNPYVDFSGGWLATPDVRNEVITYMRDMVFFRRKARVITTGSDAVIFPSAQVQIPMKRKRSHRLKEGSTPEEFEVVEISQFLGRKEFRPEGKEQWVKVPEQLMEDVSFDLIGFISETVSRDAFEAEESEFLTGEHIPLGILASVNGTPIVERIQHEGTASSSTFTAEDIRALPYHIKAVHRQNASWMGPRAFIRYTMSKLRDESGGAGTGQFMFQPGLQAGLPPHLVGFPFQESEFFPDNYAAGNADDPLALFGDFSGYWICDRTTFEMKVYDQVFAKEGYIGIKYRRRYDGAPVYPKGFVVLARN